MPKPKAFLTHSKSKMIAKEQSPDSADEYQAAGVELEEAGEKWRAGDAAKSMRFFLRAVQMYDRGLQRYPRSLDLAYNKARAQYEMVTHPVLVRQLQAPLMSVLEETLASHRYALGLEQDDADTLFNTAQVLTSIAEETAKDDAASDVDAVRCLEEALELLQRCLSLQEFRFTEWQEQAEEAIRIAEAAGEESKIFEGDLGAGENADAGPEQEEWASIAEPVTKDTLVDTAIAQLSTLTTLCGILGSSAEALGVPSLAWIEEYSSKLLNARLPTFTDGTTRTAEVAVAKAVFLSAMLEAGFRTGKIDVQTYRKERDAAFSEVALSDSAAALMANVSSLFAFNNAMSERETLPADSSDVASIRWNALATAISNLAAASKLSDPPPEDLPKTHLLRGDASLYQYQLSKPPISFPPALKNSAALLKNAEVFYRNASRLTRDDEERDRSRVQEAVVMSLEVNVEVGRKQLEAMAASRGEHWLRDHVDEVVGEGLLGEDDLQKISWSR